MGPESGRTAVPGRDRLSQPSPGRAQLSIRPGASADWVRCPRDEITWLDRALLSGNRDLDPAPRPRCAGLRYVHHRWELFSRDSSYPVYLAPEPGTAPPDAKAVQQAARHILPVAPALHYETLPVVLEAGTWLVSIGNWVLPLRLDLAARAARARRTGSGRAAGHGGEAGPGQRHADPPGQPAAAGRPAAGADLPAAQRAARMAMAFHYQEYILACPPRSRCR